MNSIKNCSLCLLVPVMILAGGEKLAQLQSPSFSPDMQNPVFNPGKQAPGTNTVWTFKTSTDNAVASLLIDSEGTDYGAVPDGHAELILRAQDELRNPAGQVLTSHDMQGRLRVMSRSFGFTRDPKRGACRGTQCPETFELLSRGNVRVTAEKNPITGRSGAIDLLVGDRPRLMINPAGGVALPDLKAPAGRRYFVCIDETGRLSSQPIPCAAAAR